MRRRPVPRFSPVITRRALGARLAAGAAALGLGGGPADAARVPDAPAADPVLRDAALRGLALADRRGDPIEAAAARAAMDRLCETDPEAALLVRLYRALDVRPAQVYPLDSPPARAGDLALLHRAVAGSRPVRFDYTDLSGRESSRMVLPLALVHPPQGVKLLAYCLVRAGYRQFFVREMRGLNLGRGDFAERRMDLLRGLVDKEGA